MIRVNHLALAAALLALPAASLALDATWPDAPHAPGIALRGAASLERDPTSGRPETGAVAPALVLELESGDRLGAGAEGDGGPVARERAVAHLGSPAVHMAEMK